MYERDTIAAISTPPGRGGIGVVRVSGPLAPEVAGAVFRGKVPLDRWRSHRLYRGYLLSVDGQVLDDGLAVWMRAPHSYTGEELVEFHAHGSPVVLRHFLAHVFARGVRPAEPGEFTKRAFLNGRLDLAQAEAVADLIEARTVAAARVAASQIAGSLSHTIHDLRETLLAARALVEAQIDFGDEVDLPTEEVAQALAEARQRLARLLASYKRGTLLRQGARVVLAGKPNVGKSSLLNALVGTDRAIVTDIPGTTRDTIEEGIDCEGIPVILVDTAGIRSNSEPDLVERLGIERSRRAMEEADLVLFVIDRSRVVTEEDHNLYAQISTRPHLIVVNKSDLPAAPENFASDRAWPEAAARVEVSARTGQGLDELCRQIAAFFSGGEESPLGSEPVLSQARHFASVLRAFEAVERAHDVLSSGLPLDIVAIEIGSATDSLAAVVGEITNEDVLDTIFARFCLGK
jgi:tRNA modification GTPase